MRRAFVLGVPFAFLVAGCTYDNGDSQRVFGNDSQTVCGSATQSTIDTDAQIVADAGVGAGLFIEYAAGGHYHVSTTCDTATNSSHASCNWDVIVTPEAGKTITNVADQNLEGGDDVHPFPPDSFQLNAVTTTETDGFTFDTDPGTAVSVDALLDGACANQYFFWVGATEDGGSALHQGSPSNPLTLVPSSD
jgi:hypothetical protein